MTDNTMTGEEALAVLNALQFGFNHSRCPVCAGFNVGPNGETDRAHMKTCPVPRLIQHVTALQAKCECDAMEADARRFQYLAKAWSSDQRISLEVAKQLTLGSLEHLREAIDAAVKAQEAEQANAGR